jgi:tRNA (cmo5U34)-methyltransferase
MSNTKQSVSMYEIEQRIKKYDSDMDVMHPNRSKMVEVALNFLQYGKNEEIKAIDLGCGTGFFTKLFVQRFPNAKIISIDGANAMIESAKSRLGSLADSVDFRVGNFQNLDTIVAEQSAYDVIFTSFALHHLPIPEKENCMKIIFDLLKPDGWFINADCIIGETKELEDIYQKLRIEGILTRAEKTDSRFKDFATARKSLDDLEAKEEDILIKHSEEIEVVQKCGFRNVDILWKEYREMVWCAQK